MSERTYTLDEAAMELARRECARHGHDFETISTGDCEPIKLLCGRCGRAWTVSA